MSEGNRLIDAPPVKRRRRFVPPLGKLRWPWRITICAPADRQPRLRLNRYPGQVIGIGLRLPDEITPPGVPPHRGLSVVWSRPARWWV